MKYEAREIRVAMLANNITTEQLTQTINNALGTEYKVDTVRAYIRGTRSNEDVENVICDLFSTWIDGQRELEKRVGGVMIPECIINENFKKI